MVGTHLVQHRRKHHEHIGVLVIAISQPDQLTRRIRIQPQRLELKRSTVCRLLPDFGPRSHRASGLTIRWRATVHQGRRRNRFCRMRLRQREINPLASQLAIIGIDVSLTELYIHITGMRLLAQFGCTPHPIERLWLKIASHADRRAAEARHPPHDSAPYGRYTQPTRQRASARWDNGSPIFATCRYCKIASSKRP